MLWRTDFPLRHIKHMFHLLGFFQKFYLLRIIYLKLTLSEFPVDFIKELLEFSIFFFFALTPLEIHVFFLEFWHILLKFQLLLLYPLEFSIGILNRGG